MALHGALWPLGLYAGLILVITFAILILSHFLGERHRDPDTAVPFESGIEPTGTSEIRFHARFYLVGIFFLVFDIEAVLLYAWAVAFWELGWAGYVKASIFIVTLAFGLAYVWAGGGLDWNPSAARRHRPA